MTKDDIIKLAREAGGLPDPMVFIGAYERFAALVLANNPPQSSVAWQEGCEFGRMAEREACAQLCDHLWESKAAGAYECATAIRARGQQ